MKTLVLVPPSKFSKNVPRDLIYGCWCKGKRIAGTKFPPITSVLVATVLKENGIEVDFCDAAGEGLNIEDLKRRINNYYAVVMLTSTMTVNEDSELLRELKQVNSDLTTIVFGAQPTFMPKQTLGKDGIDIVVRNEAEYVIRDLIQCIIKDKDWSLILGIAYRKNGQVAINPPYPLIGNLDELPVPDRTLLSPNVEYFNPIVKRIPYTTIYTARGCPGKCIFCSSPPFYGRNIRFRSAQKIMEELEIIQKLGYKEVFFRDEFFPVSKKRTLEICERILEKNIKLLWICSSRIGTVTKEEMKAMKKSGCHMIRFGVESGVQRILDSIRKEITINQIRKDFAVAREVGLDTHAHLMIGMPGETKETIETTIKFVKEINPTIVTFGIMTPYPGTQIFSIVEKNNPEIGDGSSCDLSLLHTQGFFSYCFTELSSEDLNYYLRKAYKEFYLRPSYILDWLRRIRSIDEFNRVTLAATEIFSFVRGEDS